MKKKFYRQAVTNTWVLGVLFLVAVFSMPFGIPDAGARHNEFPMETPLWVGPYDIYINPELNIAFPDTGAAYWSAKLTIPEGATLELLCQFAHARYISINTYDMVSGAPTDALHDVQIEPDPGSRNPFLTDALRAGNTGRYFTIAILNETPPENPLDREPNTLYAKAGEAGSLTLVWRLYVIDKNRDITGGVGLPEPRLILADGTVMEGDDAYAALSIDHTMFPVMPMAPELYDHLRSGAGWVVDPALMPEYFPAQDPPDWMKTFDINHTATAWYAGVTLPTPPYRVAQYANLDNQYMSVLLDRRYGALAVIRGKAPVTPKTFRRTPFMDGDVDMRYWSITTNESLATTKVVDGAYDEQIPIDEDGFYTIVVCLEGDRPRNARLRNGVKWLDWGAFGDGAGNFDDGHLILRHMLPSEDFEHVIQNVVETGTEEEILGDYFPRIRYMSTEEFEALGKRPWQQLPYHTH